MGILKRAATVVICSLVVWGVLIGPAWACAGLVTPSGNVKVLRTSTLAAYHDGVEHYITAFSYQGSGAQFGSLVPLPAIPDSIERGGDWTLQRLARETEVVAPAFARQTGAAGGTAPAEELSTTRIDGLDLTVLRGGGPAIAKWATDHGFSLTPDAPEIIDFYAERSPIFMAAVFNAEVVEARGQPVGEGTPVHITMRTENPWVPLRILGLGKPFSNDDFVRADVFLLTDERPALLAGVGGLDFVRDEPASPSLLTDLRADKGMEWIPESMWFTALRVGERADRLRYDLAVDTSPLRRPSLVAAGLARPEPPPPPTTTTTLAPTTTTITYAFERPLVDQWVWARNASAPSTRSLPVAPIVGGLVLLPIVAGVTGWHLRRRRG